MLIGTGTRWQIDSDLPITSLQQRAMKGISECIPGRTLCCVLFRCDKNQKRKSTPAKFRAITQMSCVDGGA